MRSSCGTVRPHSSGIRNCVATFNLSKLKLSWGRSGFQQKKKEKKTDRSAARTEKRWRVNPPWILCVTLMHQYSNNFIDFQPVWDGNALDVFPGALEKGHLYPRCRRTVNHSVTQGMGSRGFEENEACFICLHSIGLHTHGGDDLCDSYHSGVLCARQDDK